MLWKDRSGKKLGHHRGKCGLPFRPFPHLGGTSDKCIICPLAHLLGYYRNWHFSPQVCCGENVHIHKAKMPWVLFFLFVNLE